MGTYKFWLEWDKTKEIKFENYVPFWVQLDCDLLRHGELAAKVWN